jgi:hypothetical protein
MVITFTVPAYGSTAADRGGGRGLLTLHATGSQATPQRIRNIFRLYPLSNLRAAPAVSQPTLGQLLGIAWLAWLLDRR